MFEAEKNTELLFAIHHSALDQIGIFSKLLHLMSVSFDHKIQSVTKKFSLSNNNVVEV